MNEYYFDLNFTVNQQTSYVKHSFAVPENTGCIELGYEYLRFRRENEKNGTKIDEENIIDLGLYGPSGDLWGWSGSDKKTISISEVSSTAGYRCGQILSGSWTAVFGLYKIKHNVTVSLRIRCYPKQKQLLKGDLHMHTVNSDGAYTTAEVISYCKKAGLDFMALTDHNSTVQNTQAASAEGITVIPGMEYTNYRGHANFYFNDYSLQNFGFTLLSNNFDEMKKTFLDAKQTDTLISLNHPECDSCPWVFGYDNFPFDMIEVWNGPMKDSEIRAINRWQQWLCEGKRIAAVGGSDTHRHELARTFGSPATFVYAKGNSIKDIKRALVQGNSFISISPQGPIMNITIKGKELGDTVIWEKGLSGVLRIEGVREGDKIKLINGNNESVEFEAALNGIYTNRFAVENVLFYRIELYRELLGKSMLISLSNPVYIE